MFKKESLYINVVKYVNQLKVNIRKINTKGNTHIDNKSFLIKEDILPKDISSQIYDLQNSTHKSYISTLITTDEIKLIPRVNSSKDLTYTNIYFNNIYDIAISNTALFEINNFFGDISLDYIYSPFHIMKEYIKENNCKNELLFFIIDSKVFILSLDEDGDIIYHTIKKLITFNSIKKTHFYNDDLDAQKLFIELYYLEVFQSIKDIKEDFGQAQKFPEKMSILYSLKQLEDKQVLQLSEDFDMDIKHIPINIDEKIFALSSDIYNKDNFIQKKKEKRPNRLLLLIPFIFLILFGIYKYTNSINATEKKIKEPTNKAQLINHTILNNKIKKRTLSLFDNIPYDVVLNKFVIDENSLLLKARFLNNDSFITSLKPNLEEFYKDNQIEVLSKNKNFDIEAIISSKNKIELKNENNDKNILREYAFNKELTTTLIAEHLKTLTNKNTIIKYKSSNQNEGVNEAYYSINTIIKTPKEFFDLIDKINKESYCINIAYPISILKKDNILEVEFDLIFTQAKKL